MSMVYNYFDTLPHSWKYKKIKYLCAINQEVLDANTDPNFEFDYVDIGSVEYSKGIAEKTHMYFEDSPSRARRKVKSGDVIVSTVRTYLKAITPISESDKDIIVSTGFAVVHPQKIAKSYMAYLLTSKPFVETVVSESVGVSYPAINPIKIASIKIPLPESEELQNNIANYLDAKTENIRTQIKKIKKIIDLLKEKKEVLIITAVTKGINPDAPIKYSGINWIGNVPEHWDIKKLKWTIFKEKNGAWGEEAKDDDNDLICVRVADFDRNNSTVKLCNPTIRNFVNNNRKDFLLKRGNLLIEKSGGGELQPVGFVTHYDHSEVSICSNFIAKMQLKKGEDSRFFKYLYRALYYLKINTKSIKQTTGIQNLDTYSYFQEMIALPKAFEEQSDIADYIDQSTAHIEALIERNEELIKKLIEYQEALITAAVTGKVDVIGE